MNIFFFSECQKNTTFAQMVAMRLGRRSNLYRAIHILLKQYERKRTTERAQSGEGRLEDKEDT